MDESKIQNLLEFYKICEKLKTELRHSWTSNPNRQESVAEHTWMCSLIAITLMDNLEEKVDQLKVLKMIIIHDLVEAIAGDIPSHEISERQESKYDHERKALLEITKDIGETRKEILDLWEEFEAKETLESKFAYAIDKFECLLQHNIADISTWDEGDFRYTFVDKQDTPFDYDQFMRNLKNILDNWTMQKIKDSGQEDRIPEENMRIFRKNHK